MSHHAVNTLAVKLFHKALGFADWIQGLPGKITPPPLRLMQLGSLFWQSRVLYVAARLDIATLLGNQQLPIDDLAVKVGCHSDSPNRLLCMLISMGIFTEIEPGVISNNKTSNYLDEVHPLCVRAMILIHNSPEMTKPWMEDMETGIRKGQIPFSLAHGSDLFDCIEQKESLMLTSCDMQMPMGTEGRERTAKEWTKLCAKAGYRIAQTIDTRSLWTLQLLQST